MSRDRAAGKTSWRDLGGALNIPTSRLDRALLTACVALSACATTPRNPVLDKYPVGVSGRTTVDHYDVRVSMNVQILLPRWTPPADADSALVAEWKRFITALEVHEAGHKDISAKAGREIVERLRGLSGFCSQISTRANDVARQITERARDEQKRYDAETRHGISQGTAFGTARFTVAAGSTLNPSAIANDSVRRALLDSREGAARAAALVTRMLVTPASLDLRVGDSVASPDLFRRLDVRGVTSQGDTVLNFARTYRIEPSALVDRVGRMIVARRAGILSLWIVPGSALVPDARDTERAVRVPIHIRETTP